MTRVVFHVGPEKTGSTLVQNYFEANAAAIRDHAGHQVIFRGPIAVRDSGLLAEAQAMIRTGEGAIRTLPALLEGAGPDTTVIISHESLFGHPDSNGFYGSRRGRREVAAAMAEAAAGVGTAEFVFYYKPPHRLLESYYRHHVMHGGSLPVMDYLAIVPLGEMSFLRIHDDLTAIAGDDGVRMLDASVDDPEAFFRRFCAALGLVVDAEAPLRHPQYTNRSWSRLKTEMALIANPRLAPDERAGWAEMIDTLPLGEGADEPFVPQIITDLMIRLYADEDRRVRSLIWTD